MRRIVALLVGALTALSAAVPATADRPIPDCPTVWTGIVVTDGGCNDPFTEEYCQNVWVEVAYRGDPIYTICE